MKFIEILNRSKMIVSIVLFVILWILLTLFVSLRDFPIQFSLMALLLAFIITTIYYFAIKYISLSLYNKDIIVTKDVYSFKNDYLMLYLIIFIIILLTSVFIQMHRYIVSFNGIIVIFSFPALITLIYLIITKRIE